ncbi:MAG: type II secretion system GspH family protein [Candidatus Gracilibacteria bacterium]|nr:type II secretion system GspH family protein [Candidatus Gracilibacteria bacterium]
MNKRAFGFTLIELLVVIVILGILSTISVGTFRSYFAKARDSERVSTVQNLAMMIKVDSGGSGDAYVYRYGDDSATNGTNCIVALDAADPACRQFSELLTENDYDMPNAKNGLPFHYCFYEGAVVGHNDFFIVVGAEEDSAQNAEVVVDEDVRVFIDGTVNGRDALIAEDGGYLGGLTPSQELVWDTANNAPDTTGTDWQCVEISDDGTI